MGEEQSRYIDIGQISYLNPENITDIRNLNKHMKMLKNNIEICNDLKNDREFENPAIIKKYEELYNRYNDRKFELKEQQKRERREQQLIVETRREHLRKICAEERRIKQTEIDEQKLVIENEKNKLLDAEMKRLRKELGIISLENQIKKNEKMLEKMEINKLEGSCKHSFWNTRQGDYDVYTCEECGASYKQWHEVVAA